MSQETRENSENLTSQMPLLQHAGRVRHDSPGTSAKLRSTPSPEHCSPASIKCAHYCSKQDACLFCSIITYGVGWFESLYMRHSWTAIPRTSPYNKHLLEQMSSLVPVSWFAMNAFVHKKLSVCQNLFLWIPVSIIVPIHCTKYSSGSGWIVSQ